MHPSASFGGTMRLHAGCADGLLPACSVALRPCMHACLRAVFCRLAAGGRRSARTSVGTAGSLPAQLWEDGADGRPMHPDVPLHPSQPMHMSDGLPSSGQEAGAMHDASDPWVGAKIAAQSRQQAAAQAGSGALQCIEDMDFNPHGMLGHAAMFPISMAAPASAPPSGGAPLATAAPLHLAPNSSQACAPRLQLGACMSMPEGLAAAPGSGSLGGGAFGAWTGGEGGMSMPASMPMPMLPPSMSMPPPATAAPPSSSGSGLIRHGSIGIPNFFVSAVRTSTASKRATPTKRKAEEGASALAGNTDALLHMLQQQADRQDRLTIAALAAGGGHVGGPASSTPTRLRLAAAAASPAPIPPVPQRTQPPVISLPSSYPAGLGMGMGGDAPASSCMLPPPAPGPSGSGGAPMPMFARDIAREYMARRAQQGPGPSQLIGNPSSAHAASSADGTEGTPRAAACGATAASTPMQMSMGMPPVPPTGKPMLATGAALPAHSLPLCMLSGLHAPLMGFSAMQVDAEGLTSPTACTAAPALQDLSCMKWEDVPMPLVPAFGDASALVRAHAHVAVPQQPEAMQAGEGEGKGAGHGHGMVPTPVPLTLTPSLLAGQLGSPAAAGSRHTVIYSTPGQRGSALKLAPGSTLLLASPPSDKRSRMA